MIKLKVITNEEIQKVIEIIQKNEVMYHETYIVNTDKTKTHITIKGKVIDWNMLKRITEETTLRPGYIWPCDKETDNIEYGVKVHLSAQI